MTHNSDTLLEFPCQFPVKTFGKNTEDYQTAVLAIMHKHVPDLREDCLTERPSKDGNYLALTITFTAKDKPQLDAIYHDLSRCEHVKLAL